jgi:hypothetical protein
LIRLAQAAFAKVLIIGMVPMGLLSVSSNGECYQKTFLLDPTPRFSIMKKQGPLAGLNNAQEIK